MSNLLEESKGIIETLKTDGTQIGAKILLELLIEANIVKSLFLQIHGITDAEFNELVKIEKRRIGLMLLDESTIEVEKFRV